MSKYSKMHQGDISPKTLQEKTEPFSSGGDVTPECGGSWPTTDNHSANYLGSTGLPVSIPVLSESIFRVGLPSLLGVV